MIISNFITENVIFGVEVSFLGSKLFFKSFVCFRFFLMKQKHIRIILPRMKGYNMNTKMLCIA